MSCDRPRRPNAKNYCNGIVISVCRKTLRNIKHERLRSPAFDRPKRARSPVPKKMSVRGGAAQPRTAGLYF